MHIDTINEIERLICPRNVRHLRHLERPIHHDGVACLTDGAVIFLFAAAEAQPGWQSLEGLKKGDRCFDTFGQSLLAVSRILFEKSDPVVFPPIWVHPAWEDPYAIIATTYNECVGAETDTLAIDRVANRFTRINGHPFNDRYLWIASQFAAQTGAESTLVELGDHAMIGVKFDKSFILLKSARTNLHDPAAT